MLGELAAEELDRKARRAGCGDCPAVAAIGRFRRCGETHRARGWQLRLSKHHPARQSPQRCDVDGRYADKPRLHPDRWTRAFQRHVDRLGLPVLRGPHSLRHTWATLALEAGVHPKVVSERLDHSTIAITLDTYSHVVEGMDADAATRVADQIFKKAEEK